MNSRRLLFAVALFGSLIAPLQAQPFSIPPKGSPELAWWRDSMKTHDERMRWWREARFGMFIHRGVYSVPAGMWNGERVTASGAEGIMNRGRLLQPNRICANPVELPCCRRKDTMNRQQLLDLYYLEARSKLIDLAAFLDRLDRAEGEADFRLAAFNQAFAQLQSGKNSRAERVLAALSDPTSDPIPAATTKAACGAWPGK